MTRKRFIKLMMAHGIDRNGAAVLAYIAIDKYGSYDAAYGAIMMTSLAKIGIVVNAATAAFAQVCDVVAQRIAVLSESINNAIGDLRGI